MSGKTKKTIVSEKAKKVILAVVLVAVFIVSIILTVVGQRNVGPQGLLTMFLGLAGLIFLLWFYNRQYK